VPSGQSLASCVQARWGGVVAAQPDKNKIKAESIMNRDVFFMGMF